MFSAVSVFDSRSSSLAEVSDTDLLDLINSGDEPALSELYSRYWESVFLYVARVLRDPDEATDIVQETFIAIWQKRGTSPEIRSLKAYLLSIARYKALRVITLTRSQERYKESLLQFFNDYSDSPEAVFIASEMETVLRKHIDQLPGRMREIFILNRYEHLSYAEIAQRLDISDKTVKKQIHNALRYLRTVLDEKHMWATLLLCALAQK